MANFIKSINARRAIDCAPRTFVAELRSHAAQNNLNFITEAVDYAIGVPKPAALSIQGLYATLDLSGPTVPVAPELLQPALRQLSFDWASISYEIRTPPPPPTHTHTHTHHTHTLYMVGVRVSAACGACVFVYVYVRVLGCRGGNYR